jgi:hypothetical protein
MQAGVAECDAIHYEAKCLMVNPGYGNVLSADDVRWLMFSVAESSHHRRLRIQRHIHSHATAVPQSPSAITVQSICKIVTLEHRTSIDLVITSRFGLGLDYA